MGGVECPCADISPRKDNDRFQALRGYPGDFDFPRVEGCEEAGACHDWSSGQYIDTWASVGTNWDHLGRGAENHMHFDSMATDTWKAGDAPDGAAFWGGV